MDPFPLILSTEEDAADDTYVAQRSTSLPSLGAPLTPLPCHGTHRRFREDMHEQPILIRERSVAYQV